MSVMFRSCLVLAAVSLTPATVALAVGGAPGSTDWPCPQRKVVSLAASDVQWQGADPSTVGDWRRDGDVAALVKALASRRTPMDDAVKALKAYAAKLPTADRPAKLAQVFAGVLETVNEYRKAVIDGIERFNKRQKVRASEIEQEGAHMAELQKAADKDPAAKAEYDKAQELYDWNARVFEDRRQNLPLACEIPPAIDSRTFDLVRELNGLLTNPG